MKYYSRSPSELNEHLTKATCSTDKAARRGKIIFFLNIVIILMVLGILQVFYQRQEAGKLKLSQTRNFQWEGWQIQSACYVDTGCALQFDKTGNAKTLGKITWECQNSSSNCANGVFDQLQDTNAFQIPAVFSQDSKVFVTLHSELQQQLLQFRVFP
ncbi:MAG: hypothetical protein KDK38_03530 [Leptospiraceae bacterium]|nr:hypothetical protein [Leptospiraceae bacterium]